MKILTQIIGKEEKDHYLSLYFHIPFCSRKCPYCHFYVVKTSPPFLEKLIDSLKKEFELLYPKLINQTIYSIYFGGGTPSQLPPSVYQEFLSYVFKFPLKFHPHLEITLEANPEDLSKDYLEKLSQTRINRLSIGVQSLEDDLLHVLNRQHDSKKALDAIYTAHNLGMNNISIDLMYDLPTQTMKHWLSTLNQVKDLPITHLSLYNLTLEPQTVFFKRKNELIPLIPKEEESLQFLTTTIDALSDMGLKRYEISAFAKDHLHSKHNTGYWLGRTFFGLGPSAFSFDGKSRFANIANLHEYSRRIDTRSFATEFHETLDEIALVKELLAIRLRLLEGVDLSSFSSIPDETLSDLQALSEEGFLTLNSDRAVLTEKGLLFYDTVAERLI